MAQIPAPSPSGVSYEEVRLVLHDAPASTAAQNAEKRTLVGNTRDQNVARVNQACVVVNVP